VLAIIQDGRSVEWLKAGEEGEIILSETPFYAESGGQVGDRGLLKASGFSAVVENTHKPIPELIVHQVRVLAGEIRPGQKVEGVVDSVRRKAISRNHTSTHLLHVCPETNSGRSCPAIGLAC